jgi:hypothetical protein
MFTAALVLLLLLLLLLLLQATTRGLLGSVAADAEAAAASAAPLAALHTARTNMEVRAHLCFCGAAAVRAGLPFLSRWQMVLLD